MYRTPKSSIVSTRNAKKRAELTRLANEVLKQNDAAKSEPPPCDTASLQQDDDKIEKRHDEKSGILEHVPRSRTSRSQSVSSSVMARKKRLELEAAEAKTRLQMDLIDKKLAVDLAELEEEVYSPLMEKQEVQTQEEVEKWLERSQNDMDSARNAHEHGEQQSGEPCQPPPPSAIDRGVHGTMEETLHMLAGAVHKLTAASTHNVPNLLSRLSTPRDLPVFSGDPIEWLQFKQAFEESTEVCGFSNKENLWRLRKCLRDKAKDTVSALLTSATSTETIMATLELRFGNPDTIISRITQDLQKLQPMSQEYHKDIVMFAVKVKNYVAAVNAVGRQEYLQGVSIVSLLLSKFPTVLISRWTDYSFPLIKENKKSRLEILSDFLHEEAVKASTTASLGIIPTRSNNMQHQQKNPHKEHSKHNLHTVLLQSQEKDKCLFCRAAIHKLTECKQFKKALRKERWRHVKRHGVCYRCLVSRHNRETCSAPACDKDDCGGAHHRLLHYTVNNRRDEGVTEDHNTTQENPNTQETSITTTSSETVTNINASDNQVLLKVISVNIHGPNGTISATALLDDGSTISLISSALASRAGLRGRPECLRVRGAWIGNELECESTIMNLRISDVNNKNVHEISVRSVTELNLPKQNIGIVNCNNYPHLLKLKDKLQCNINCQPDILIGQDNYHLLLPLKVSLGKPNEPSASLTPLGWCIHGVVPRNHTLGSTSTTLATLFISGSNDSDADADEVVHKLRDIHEEVRHYFSIDSLGVTVKARQNINDVRAITQLEQTSVLINGEWHVGLPWKAENCKMPDSYPSALKRLKAVEKKMSSSNEYSQRYVERVDHLFANGFARVIDESEPPGKVWYLLHFGVDNPNKKKLRLVFDAAAKAGGMSLNSVTR